jgi:hypothetical protein
MIVTGIAALLALVALTQPLWALQTEAGGRNIDKAMYAWTARVEEEWRNGTLANTRITPYASPTFTDFRMRDAAVTTYAAGALYGLLLVVLVGLQFGVHRGRISRGAGAGFHLVVSVIGIAALAYAALAIPPAARIDIEPSVTGFWGQAGVAGEVFSWGPAAAWWLWAASVFLAFIALAVSLVQRRKPAGNAPTL